MKVCCDCAAPPADMVQIIGGCCRNDTRRKNFFSASEFFPIRRRSTCPLVAWPDDDKRTQTNDATSTPSQMGNHLPFGLLRKATPFVPRRRAHRMLSCSPRAD